MNRGRSSESLSSNGSSSPTDFTSDDEVVADIDMPINKIRSRTTALNSINQTAKIDKYSPMQPPTYSRNINPFQSHSNIIHQQQQQQQHQQQQQLSPISRRTKREDFLKSYQQPERYQNDILLLKEFAQKHRAGHSREDENVENHHVQHHHHHQRSLLVDDDDDEDDDTADLFGRVDSQMEITKSPLAGVINVSNRNLHNTIAIRMCFRLVECRNLIEAIEFVEQNRNLIDDLTRIITHDAPAFRNYDMSNYQIDHSVKESFNPNFWLDREPVITTADGNCQYHAISLSLTGSEAYTPEVRLATAVAVIDNREWFDSMLKLIDRGTVLDLIHTIARNYSWGDETTLKAVAVAINRRIFLYTCNIGKKDYEMVKSLSKEELLDAFREKKYRGGTGIHTFADPLVHVPANNYIMLFHKSEHFIAVLPTCQQLTMFEPYNPIVPVFS